MGASSACNNWLTWSCCASTLGNCCQVSLQGAPHSLDGVQLWTVGRQPHRLPLRRPPHPLGGVRPAVIAQQDVQAVRKGLGEGIHQELQGSGRQIRPFEKEPLPGGRSDSATAREPLAVMLDRPHGLDPARGEPASAHG